MTKTAFVTGAGGQCGSFLCELLLEKGYIVFGLNRRKATDNGHRNLKNIIDHKNFNLISGDITDASCMIRLVEEIEPDEIYSLAAQSFVGESWKSPQATMEINSGGTLNILEAVRIYTSNPNHYITPKVYLACSSEMFGKVQEVPQNEQTLFYPRSPYGVSKCATYWMGKNYRESFGLFVSNGILFNNESERRGYEFVTRKITDFVARLKLGLTKENLKLGNIKAKRDWGYSFEYVEAMWLMLQQDKPDDYVIATGKEHSVEDFAKAAFSVVGLDYQNHIDIDKKFMRPAEVETLLGDASKAKKELGWEPKITFEDMIKRMVLNDIEINKKELKEKTNEKTFQS